MTAAELQRVEGTNVGLTLSTEGRGVLFLEMSGLLVSANRKGLVIEPFGPAPSAVLQSVPEAGGRMHVPFRYLSIIETVRGRIVLRDYWSLES